MNNVDQVRWGGFVDKDEGEDDNVRRRLARTESVGVADLHDPLRRPTIAYANDRRRSSLHFQVLGMFFLFFFSKLGKKKF